MDDVEDNSELRRGSPVAHTIYGVPQTINTANYVYFQAVQELLELQRGHRSQDTGKGKGKETESEMGSGEGHPDLIRLVTGKFRSLHPQILAVYSLEGAVHRPCVLRAAETHR
jgi:geranylgeranyl diphosphate synthase type 3